MGFLKLIAATLFGFLLFAGVLFWNQRRKNKRKKKCADHGEHRCRDCRCE